MYMREEILNKNMHDLQLAILVTSEILYSIELCFDFIF